MTSLVQQVNTHGLVQDVRVDLPGRDPVRDLLALDGDVLRVYESSGLDSPVVDQSGSATLQALTSEGLSTDFRLQAPATDGFFYVRIADPTAGAKIVHNALCSDGRVRGAPNV